MKRTLALPAAALALLLAPAAHAADVLLNGSFEDGITLDRDQNGNNIADNARGQTPASWVQVAGLETPDVIGPDYTQGSYPFAVLLAAKDGDLFLDMNGASVDGGLYQDVAHLKVGTLATLTYWVGQWAENSAGELVASLIDPVTHAAVSASTVIPANPDASGAWVQYSLQAFVPTSGILRVQFTGSSPDNAHGAPGLDLVSLDAQLAAPEPASWALMISGFGLAGAALRRRRGAPAAA